MNKPVFEEAKVRLQQQGDQPIKGPKRQTLLRCGRSCLAALSHQKLSQVSLLVRCVRPASSWFSEPICCGGETRPLSLPVSTGPLGSCMSAPVPGRPSTRSPHTMKNLGLGCIRFAAAIACCVNSISASHLKAVMALLLHSRKQSPHQGLLV